MKTDGVAGARPYSRIGPQSSLESLVNELEAIRLLLDQGQASQAESRLNYLVKSTRHEPSLLARARCMLSVALEIQSRHRESLEVVQIYEPPDARKKLEADAAASVRVHLGLAYKNAGDHPKAIALLNAVLRDASEAGSVAQIGEVNLALSRVYRSINEYRIAQDYAHKALEHYRRAGGWRGLSESYVGIAMADIQVGDHETALENFEQAIRLIGDHSVPFLLGKIYADAAAACWHLRRPQDGIRYLEKAIAYYERTDDKSGAASGYNNLGIHLVLIGEWNRAQEAFERAVALTSETDELGARASVIFDSIGELHMLRGNLDEAQSLLERAVKLATESGNKWYAEQALRTLTRCYLARTDTRRALVEAQKALSLAEGMGDHQGVWEVRVLLAEAYLQSGDTEQCAALLQNIFGELEDSVAAHLGIMGEAQRLAGLLALAQEDAILAAHHFARSLSIFEMLRNRYCEARAHYDLGRAYALVQPDRAREQLSFAVATFRELGAHLALSQAEAALASFASAAPKTQREEPPALLQLLTLRLTEAVASRELLLRELASIVYQETGARRVLILEPEEDGRAKVIMAHGCTSAESTRLAEAISDLETEHDGRQLALKHDATVIQLRAKSAKPATLFISPRASTLLPGGGSLDPLLRVAEMGIDLCALRESARADRGSQNVRMLANQSIMPGFIHSSPAMARLVDEMRRIRSSDVTVLVTGASGTGKELVARAVHNLSSRRSESFVPFNCTAVPKELSEGYLFGYRKGAFTGAAADSTGVIRTAAGGTLFIDEVGDLPLDVQPKLLRFLQEGEIQPLGEQRPLKVDVRVIAATNTDLERIVEEGRFREDLYYRLNVIRLRVPPLRERRSEIPLLVNYYLNHYSTRFSLKAIQITPQTVDLMMVYDWPGNVRQLCNEIQRIVARVEDGTLITPEHLSPELIRGSVYLTGPASTISTNTAAGASLENLSLAAAVVDLERRMIAEALRNNGGNISRAARQLGLTRRGLQLKLGRYEMSAGS